MKLVFVIFIVCYVNLSFLLNPIECADEVNHNGDAAENSKPSYTNDNTKAPTILIVTLFRNTSHIMPLFFSYLNKIASPKNRISLWIRSDHNEDKSVEVLYTWLYKWANSYHNINIEYDNTTQRRDSETSQTHWPEERYLDVIRMKEMALKHARNIWADYIFYLDADVLLTQPNILHDLIALNEPIVAPMLLSENLYSNFWCAMTPDYYYQRTDDYKKIYSYQQSGQFDVAMIHTAVLVNLNDKRSDSLTFNKTILGERFALSQDDLALVPIDDIIIFALSANYSQLPLKISNSEIYGYITIPLEVEEDLYRDEQQLTNLKIMILNGEQASIDVDREFKQYTKYPEPDTMSFDSIFMINLVRRPERRIKMERSFKEIGLDFEHVEAIDGKQLTYEYLDEIGVKFLPGYADPFHNRPMTMGEIGCFLSHFWIWEKQVMLNLNEVLVLEDDIRFEPYFKQRALHLLNEARQIGGWDLIYFGRKQLLKKNEKLVANSEQLVHASYSYWTLGYALSLTGAKKLLAAKPLENLIPVDEFLPVMFNQHQNETWKAAFPNRNLVAWSAAPLLLFPTHYTGEEGYLSDTEESDTININGETIFKDGVKKNFSQRGSEAFSESRSESDTNTNASASNASIETFIINKVNEHASIPHQSDGHTEL